MNPDEIVLDKTCDACPEQYEAYYRGAHVAYLRLRHGLFSVAVPDTGGEIVYHAMPEGDGMFERHEREMHLTAARMAISAYYTGTPLMATEGPRVGRSTRIG